MTKLSSMVLTLLLALLITFVTLAEAQPKWHQLDGYNFDRYAKDFSKTYASEEERGTRRALFERKLAAVHAHNTAGVSTYKKGINVMSDRTETELQAMRGGRAVEMSGVKNQLNSQSHVKKFTASGEPIPRNIDYRGRVPAIATAVKNQAQCGSCWIFASTTVIESQWALRTGQLWDLSQGQMTQCVPNPAQCGGTGGCMGGIAELVYEYVRENGIPDLFTAPYLSSNGTSPSCPLNPIKTNVKLSGYIDVEKNNEAAVLEALSTIGPLAVNVDASQWNDYETGIYDGCSYAKNISIDHVVVLMGTGYDAVLNQEYYLIRNSWTPAFGEEGYIRLAKPKTAQCGNNVNNQDGVGCKGQPSTVQACGTCGLLYSVSVPVVDTSAFP